MKKALFLSLLLGCSCCIFALGAGGTATDPLISLSYLKEVFPVSFQTQVDKALDEADASLQAKIQTELKSLSHSNTPTKTESSHELSLKVNDQLTVQTGTTLLPLTAGTQMQVNGVCIDMTTATEYTENCTLSPYHRYLVGENSSVSLSTPNKISIIQCNGGYSLQKSNTTDYRALADALYQLSLFRGTGSGYGNGYDLEQSLTRAQALVMLIRLLGEEEDALATTEPCPFADAQNSWVRPYVAYAYAKGYTNGVSATAFGVNQTASGNMYVEFVLRALGYSSTATTNIQDAPERAMQSAVLTTGEANTLKTTGFLRADAVYLSYYALDTKLANSTQTLAQRLMEKGVFSKSVYHSAQSLITAQRNL